HRVPLQVLSSFEDAIGSDRPGTLVGDEGMIAALGAAGGDGRMESKVVSGVAFSREEAKITLQRVADRPGVASTIFGPLSAAGVNVDMIVQNVSDAGLTDMTFTVSLTDYERALAVIEGAREAIGFADVLADRDVAKVSIVGTGMRSHVGVAQTMFQALADEGVNIQVITTSEIKVSVLIERKYLELAVRALHSAFDLGTTAAE
ncbi:MAG: ACT domain-containing protein, partial [Pseudomonadota bacterium]